MSDQGTAISDSTKGVTQKSETLSFSLRWKKTINIFRHQIARPIRWAACISAARPRLCVALCIFMSLLVLVIGLFTGFNIDTDEGEVWAPKDSYAMLHGGWVRDYGGYPSAQRKLILFVHDEDGENIANIEGMKYTFEALNAVTSLPGYDGVCSKEDIVASTVDYDYDDVELCPLISATQFWGNNATLFDESIDNHEDLLRAFSSDEFLNGAPVYQPAVFGNVGMLYGAVVFVQSYPIIMSLPNNERAVDFEADVVDRIIALNEEWTERGNYRVRFFTDRSFDDEFDRGMIKDIPLIPFSFVMMAIFTCAVFAKRHPVESRSLLGFGAVAAVLLSLIMSYGLMFCVGVPFTSISQILPFIMFGIGLDDAFIIIGAYNRTDPRKNTITRIDETMEDIASSILLTTITSASAFGFGALSSIPAIIFLCHYAYVAIFVIFVFQCTFFVALIVIDEERRANNRRDCCPCCISNVAVDEEEEVDEEQQIPQKSEHSEPEFVSNDWVDRMMGLYAEKLLRPWVKVVVVSFFVSLFCICAWRTMLLDRKFEYVSVLPKDSYVRAFYSSVESYSNQFKPDPAIYFRCVDQSDELVQQYMEDYIEALNEIDEISGPQRFWLRDYKLYKEHRERLDPPYAELTFNEQLEVFLEDPFFHGVYKNDIVRDQRTGNILTSRTYIKMNVDDQDSDQLIRVLLGQRGITADLPVNKMNLCENVPGADGDSWAFFTYSELYLVWEFYAIVINELLFTTVVAIGAVTVVGMLLIPHWSAFFFALPLITILYIDLLGILQFAGLRLNPLTYLGMVMSIGLMVDFIMHVLLRYYECDDKVHRTRHSKVVNTLQTIGASVLLGGLSSFLGVLPLAATSTNVINTIFIVFISLVSLGIGHGLVLLPVILSIVGPLDKSVAHNNDVKGLENDVGIEVPATPSSPSTLGPPSTSGYASSLFSKGDSFSKDDSFARGNCDEDTINRNGASEKVPDEIVTAAKSRDHLSEIIQSISCNSSVDEQSQVRKPDPPTGWE